ncbi:glycosyltransferase [Hyalangium minutum]|nr:glycosyltransferase [Hyalangium minutum]
MSKKSLDTPSSSDRASGRSPVPPLATLPEFSGDSPAEISRTFTAGELAEMVAAQRRALQAQQPCSSTGCQDLMVQQRILQLLTREMKSRLPEDSARPHTPLQAARKLADILHFEVPPSHRKGVGRAVTAAKSVFVQGLKPLHVEMLRPQYAFNNELLAVIEYLQARSATTMGMDLGDWVRRRLEPMRDTSQWQVASHRRSGVGKAVKLVKSSWLQAMGPWLRELMAGQQRWNEAAVELLVLAANPRSVTLDERARRVAELHALNDPFAQVQLPKAAKASLPLWREVFRRQASFNNEVSLCLANLLETRVPASAAPVADNYEAWCAEREPAWYQRSAAALETLSRKPLISVVVPVYETPEPILRQCIDSVRAQSYGNWELCLANDGSRSPHVERVLSSYAQTDARIRFKTLPANAGISAATNAAIEMATGDFVAFFDHDDVLAPNALAEMVLRLDREPELDLLYSDEDRLGNDGRRFGPFFKPDWSPDLLRSVNYICHFVVVRRTLLAKAGGLRDGFQGSQDFEFLLRLSEHTPRIAHVPGILYHWRASDISLSQDPAKLQAASAAGVRALTEHLQRLNEPGTVEEVAPTHYRVRYPVRGTPLVSIIVPFKDKPELLRTLTSTLLEKTRYTNYELLLVSNNSTKPETFALLETLTDPRIRKLTWDHPFNYPAINNFAAREARGDLLLFLNNDMEVIDPGWLEELIGQAQRPEVGAVGAKLLFPDGTLQHAGVVVGLTGFAGHPFWRVPDTTAWTPFGHADWVRNYLSVTSACVMLRREVFEAMKGFDERFVVCGSDVDIGLRLVEAGLRVVYTPHCKLVHHESASRRLDSIPENDFWMSYSVYRPYLLKGDPFYNPNLTLLSTDATLRRHTESGEELAVRTLVYDLPSAQSSISAERAQHQRHVADHLKGLDYTSAQADEARRQAPERLAALRQKGRIDRICWFIPSFHHPYGGIHTILRFADMLKRRHGAESDLVIYTNPQVTAAEMQARASVLYPEPPGRFRVLRSMDEVKDLPECDVAIATFWTSAYSVLEHPRAMLKAYFIQDYEPQFFTAGTYSALAEQTYRMGLYGIFNTQGLYDYVTKQYPMQGCWFEPTVDRSIFHDRRPERRGGPVRVFFYGRPSTDRNAFELGIATLRQLKQELGPAVEIVTAGEKWDPEQYGLQGVINSLGVLPYERTADLYRECDVGLCFMFTKHPSYLPFELMACGVTVVTNDNPANHWLLEHGKNCLLAEPTYSCVLEQLRAAVTNTALRASIRTEAAERILRTTWEEQVDRVHAQLVHGEGAHTAQGGAEPSRKRASGKP